MEENIKIENTESEPTTEITAAEPNNLDICPNCLEPNTENLAVCKYCGMPLRPGADPESFEKQETEEELAANRAAATPPESSKPKKKQEGGFRRVMPWLGLYIIYYAVTGIIDTSRRIKAAPEEISNPTLAYASWVIYIAAGLLMAWPLIMKGWRKLRHLPDPEEEAQEEAAENTDGGSAAGTEQSSGESAAEETVPENTASEDHGPETAPGETKEDPAQTNKPLGAEEPAAADSQLKEGAETEETEIDESESEFEEEDRDAARWL